MATGWGAYFKSYVKAKQEEAPKTEASTSDASNFKITPISNNEATTLPTATSSAAPAKKLYDLSGATPATGPAQKSSSNAARVAAMFGYAASAHSKMAAEAKAADEKAALGKAVVERAAEVKKAETKVEVKTGETRILSPKSVNPQVMEPTPVRSKASPKALDRIQRPPPTKSSSLGMLDDLIANEEAKVEDSTGDNQTTKASHKQTASLDSSANSRSTTSKPASRRNKPSLSNLDALMDMLEMDIGATATPPKSKPQAQQPSRDASRTPTPADPMPRKSPTASPVISAAQPKPWFAKSWLGKAYVDEPTELSLQTTNLPPTQQPLSGVRTALSPSSPATATPQTPTQQTVRDKDKDNKNRLSIADYQALYNQQMLEATQMEAERQRMLEEAAAFEAREKKLAEEDAVMREFMEQVKKEEERLQAEQGWGDESVYSDDGGDSPMDDREEVFSPEPSARSSYDDVVGIYEDEVVGYGGAMTEDEGEDEAVKMIKEQRMAKEQQRAERERAERLRYEEEERREEERVQKERAERRERIQAKERERQKREEEQAKRDAEERAWQEELAEKRRQKAQEALEAQQREARRLSEERRREREEQERLEAERLEAQRIQESIAARQRFEEEQRRLAAEEEANRLEAMRLEEEAERLAEQEREQQRWEEEQERLRNEEQARWEEEQRRWEVEVAEQARLQRQRQQEAEERQRAALQQMPPVPAAKGQDSDDEDIDPNDKEAQMRKAEKKIMAAFAGLSQERSQLQQVKTNPAPTFGLQGVSVATSLNTSVQTSANLSMSYKSQIPPPSRLAGFPAMPLPVSSLNAKAPAAFPPPPPEKSPMGNSGRFNVTVPANNNALRSPRSPLAPQSPFPERSQSLGGPGVQRFNTTGAATGRPPLQGMNSAPAAPAAIVGGPARMNTVAGPGAKGLPMGGRPMGLPSGPRAGKVGLPMGGPRPPRRNVI